jgi:hypothetical protein
MTEAVEPVPSPFSALTGAIIVIVGIACIILWMLLGSMIGITSYFAGLTFFWYWAAVEQLDFKQIPQSLIGALVGLLLAWQAAYLPVHYGTAGTVIGLTLIIAAIYVQLMNWVPIAINRSTMLFLTFMGAPALLKGLDVIETGGAILFAAIFFCGLIKLVFTIGARRSARNLVQEGVTDGSV